MGTHRLEACSCGLLKTVDTTPSGDPEVGTDEVGAEKCPVSVE